MREDSFVDTTQKRSAADGKRISFMFTGIFYAKFFLFSDDEHKRCSFVPIYYKLARMSEEMDSK